LYQQTLIFSSLQTPQINSLFSTYCHNYAGGVRCDSEASGGSVEQVARQLPQVFSRLCCPSFPQLPDAQLHHFTAQVLPGYQGDLMKGTLIFIPSYFDFVRVRNSMKKMELSFAAISESLSPGTHLQLE
jgi:U3 small nucleolar RNA-associated protein 25